MSERPEPLEVQGPEPAARLVPVDRVLLERDERERRHLGKARFVLAGAALAFVVTCGALLLVLLLETRDTALDVESCIAPGGDCYERSVEVQRGAEERQLLLEQVLRVLCEQDQTASCP